MWSLAQLKRAHKGARPWVILTTAHPESLKHLLGLNALGVYFWSHDDVEAIVRDRIAPLRAAGTAALILAIESCPQLSPVVRHGLAAAVTAIVTGSLDEVLDSVAAVARRLGCSVRTLHRECAAAGFTPGVLVRWVRTLHGVELRCGGASWTRVAMSVGCPSVAAYYNLVRRLTGMSPTEAELAGPGALTLRMAHDLPGLEIPCVGAGADDVADSGDLQGTFRRARL